MAFVIAISIGSHDARAALSPYTFTGDDVSMGTLSSGQSGVIGSIGNVGNVILSRVSGTLPANTLVTFTYNFSGNLERGSLTSTANYSYIDGGDVFSGFVGDSNLTGSNSAGNINGSPSTALAVASAQVDFSNNTATAIIQNNSSGAVSFLDLFVGFVSGSKNLEISYNVSAVPLPAALPLFASAIAALAGLSYRRKKAAASAA